MAFESFGPGASNPAIMPNSPQDGPFDFERLLQQARVGDAQAVNELLQKYYQYMLAVANDLQDERLMSKAGASDFVQDAMLVIRSRLDQFSGNTRGEFVAWIRQIVTNQYRQFRRQFDGTAKRRASRELPMDQFNESKRGVNDLLADSVTPSGLAVRAEQEDQVLHALSHLPTDYQEVLKLRYWEQLTFVEIGIRTNRSGDAVRKLVTRAMLQLQQALLDRPQPDSQS